MAARARLRALPEKAVLTNNFALSAGRFCAQLGSFQPRSAVHVVVHDDAREAVLALCSKNQAPERGTRYELRHNVGQLLAALRGRPESDPVHVLVYRASQPKYMPRRCSPRSVLCSGANGAIAEIHVDTWRYATSIPYERTLDIEIDLDDPWEPTTSNTRIDKTPLAIWMPHSGWARG